MMEGDLNFKSDVARRVLQTVLNTGKFKALNDNEKEQIADVYKTGTVLGRALASRRLSLLAACRSEIFGFGKSMSIPIDA